MDPKTGKLYEVKDEADALKRGLVPAPFATQEQIKRGRVFKGEGCPCGSGKPAKKCCMRNKYVQSIKLS